MCRFLTTIKIIRSALDGTLKSFYVESNDKGCHMITVHDCSSFAVPFIMFRLKREGYSNVKAECSNGMVEVSFIR